MPAEVEAEAEAAEAEAEAEGQPQVEAALHPAFSCRPRPRPHEITCQECAGLEPEGMCKEGRDVCREEHAHSVYSVRA